MQERLELGFQRLQPGLEEQRLLPLVLAQSVDGIHGFDCTHAANLSLMMKIVIWKYICGLALVDAGERGMAEWWFGWQCEQEI